MRVFQLLIITLIITLIFFSLVQEFIIHSPDFEAAKFWVGNMGKTATHAVVFAQLYTPEGQCHGLHPFVVQVRWLSAGQHPLSAGHPTRLPPRGHHPAPGVRAAGVNQPWSRPTITRGIVFPSLW